jgi:hypothetical protein
MIPRYLRKSMVFALFLLVTLSASSCCDAKRVARSMSFVARNDHKDHHSSNSVVAAADKVHAVRGGSMTSRPWGFLHDIQEDLAFWSQSSSTQHDQITAQSEHRCSRQDVVHECVINYGFTMLGRF